MNQQIDFFKLNLTVNFNKTLFAKFDEKWNIFARNAKFLQKMLKISN